MTSSTIRGSSGARTGGIPLVAAGLTYCIEHPEDAEADGYPLDAMQKMFMKLA